MRVGVLFEMAPGWHLYWRNSGEAGFPTALTWKTDGAALGPLQWPAPALFREADDTITVYGYGGSVLLFADARAKRREHDVRTRRLASLNRRCRGLRLRFAR